MAVFSQPTLWDHTLGNNADVSVLPDDTLGTTGLASLQKLFQLINQTPLAAGGIAPSREDFNALFKLLGDSIFYMQNGGLWEYTALFDYPVGAIVKYNNVLYEAVQANGPSSTVAGPTDATYWSQIPTYADLAGMRVPVGTVTAFAGSVVPNDYLLCNGGDVSRTSYSDLFAAIGTTHGAGDGSTTFNLPDMRDRYPIGVGTNILGTQIAEQLPNITGKTGRILGDHTEDYSGSLSTYYDAIWFGTQPGGNNFNGVKIDFNANSSNSVYTDSGKVYPASIALNFIIKT